MPKILMKQTVPGSMDGVTIHLFKVGKEYEVDDNEITQSLATSFVNARFAILVRERIASVAPSAPVVLVSPTEMTVEDGPSEIKAKEVVEEVIEEVVTEIKSTRIYELARKLNKPWQEVVLMSENLGIEANKAQSGLTDSEVKRIKKGFKEGSI